MEGESFESTNVESTSVETTGSYEESSASSYESGEGYSEDSSSTGDNASGDSGASSGSEESTIASATSDEGTNFELYTDPTTGKVEFRASRKTEESEESEEDGGETDGNSDGNAEEEAGQTSQEPAPEGLTSNQQLNNAYNNATQAPPKYSLDEFSYALANGVVDDRRVPDEYQAQYADYKISQAKAAYNQRMQAEQARQAQVAQQMQNQSTPEARIAANETFYKNLENEATRLAMQDLGVTKEQLDDAEYSDDGGEAIKARLETAKNWHKNNLMNQLQGRYNQEQAYRAQQKQIYGEIGAFTTQAQKSEPHFQEIDKMLATAWQEMPTKYGAVVQNALQSLAAGTVTRQQAQVIQKYYEDTRKLYYARQNGLKQAQAPQQKKRPPVVEHAGDGRNEVADKAPDYSALRKADARGKKAWLADFFKGIEL